MTGVLLARQLAPEGRGELAAVILWPSVLAALGSLGLPEGTTYYASRGQSRLGLILGTSLVLALAQSAVLIGIGLGLLPLVLGGYDGEVVAIALLVLAFIPLNLVTLSFMSALNGMQRYASFQSLRATYIAVNAVGLSLLAATGELTVRSAAAVFLGANVVTAIAAAVVAIVAFGSSFGFSAPLARELLGFGCRSHLGSVSSLFNERLDQLVISIVLGPVKLGLYVVAVTIASLSNLVGGSIATVALPAVARLESSRERLEAAKRFIRLTFLLAAALSIPVLVFAPELIGLFFGPSFEAAASAARLLLVAATVFSTNRVLGAVLQGLGRPLAVGLGELAGVAVTVVGLAVLLPTLGLAGAAVASIVAYLVAGTWMVRRLAHSLKITVRELAFGAPRLATGVDL